MVLWETLYVRSRQYLYLAIAFFIPVLTSSDGIYLKTSQRGFHSLQSSSFSKRPFDFNGLARQKPDDLSEDNIKTKKRILTHSNILRPSNLLLSFGGQPGGLPPTGRMPTSQGIRSRMPLLTTVSGSQNSGLVLGSSLQSTRKLTTADVTQIPWYGNAQRKLNHTEFTSKLHPPKIKGNTVHHRLQKVHAKLLVTSTMTNKEKPDEEHYSRLQINQEKNVSLPGGNASEVLSHSKSETESEYHSISKSKITKNLGESIIQTIGNLTQTKDRHPNHNIISSTTLAKEQILKSNATFNSIEQLLYPKQYAASYFSQKEAPILDRIFRLKLILHSKIKPTSLNNINDLISKGREQKQKHMFRQLIPSYFIAWILQRIRAKRKQISNSDSFSSSKYSNGAFAIRPSILFRKDHYQQPNSPVISNDQFATDDINDQSTEKRGSNMNFWKRGRPRWCNYRHVNMRMLIEFLTKGKMCGSSIIRLRFGLGRR